MLANSVLPGTRRQYNLAKENWMLFRQQHGDGVADPFNLRGTRASMIILILEWFQWLQDVEKFSAGVIGRLASGLNFHCEIRVIHAGVFEHPSIIRARKAVAPAAQRRAANEQIMGINLELVQALRNQLWVGGPVDQRMTYIAIATGYNYTLRPGHITFMGRGKEDHRYLLGDITVEALRDGHMYSFMEWISSGADPLTRIEIGLIILRLDSSKSHGARHGGDGTLSFVSPGNEFETQFFQDFVQWLGECGLEREAIRRGKISEEGTRPILQRPIFSRVHCTTGLFKMSRSKDITKAIKTGADLCGLPASSFTAKSMRIGGCTTAVAAGASSDDIQRATGHASVATSLIYTRRTRHQATVLGYGSPVFVQDLNGWGSVVSDKSVLVSFT
jgi:hypothetical protein